MELLEIYLIGCSISTYAGLNVMGWSYFHTKEFVCDSSEWDTGSLIFSSIVPFGLFYFLGGIVNETLKLIK